MSEKISLYNPRDTPPEQLEAMLTGREPLLKEILDSLREQVDAPTRQHWLLRGPRGIGKTHLTGIIHHRVQSDAALSKAYLPLWLGEADVYEVYSPATLLLRICERLEEATPGAALTRKFRALEGGGEEDMLFEELTSLLTEEAERQGRVLLVLMENLDALFESFAPKQRTAQTRQLRSLLLGNPCFLFISTTPTQYLKELSNPKFPLFAQLKERKLSQLKVEEVGSLFAKLTRITGRKELLGSGSDALLKQRIIHQLTGGLPRSVVMAFEVLRDKEGIQVLVEDLRTFLDAQTAYFEARLSRLAPRERSIVTTLALADQNLTLKEISGKSLLPEKSLSTHMARLQQEGHVEAVEGAGGKGTLYGLSEGLFRIWYQYRKGRLLLKPLVQFLAYWYEPDEIQGVADVMQQRITQEGLVTHSMKLTLLQIQAAHQLATSEQGRMERDRIWEQCRRAVEAARHETSQSELDEFAHTLGEVIRLVVCGQEKEAGDVLDQCLMRDTSSQNWPFLACHMLTQKALNPSEYTASKDFELLRFVVDRFGSHPELNVRLMSMPARLVLGEALFRKGQNEQALTCLDAFLKAVKVEPFQKKDKDKLGPSAWRVRYLRIQLLMKMGRNDEALRACEDCQKEIGDHETFEARNNLLYVLIEHSSILGGLGNFAEAEKLLQEAVHVQIDPSDKIAQASLFRARIRLVLLGVETDRMDYFEISKSITEWLGEVRQGVVLPFEEIQSIASLRDQIDNVLKRESSAASAVRSAFWQASPAERIPFFLNEPSLFFKIVPRRELIDWLREALNTELPPEQSAQLQRHLSALEFADAALTKGPEASRRIKQSLGRAPVEMRELFKSLLERLRAPHSGEKEAYPFTRMGGMRRCSG